MLLNLDFLSVRWLFSYQSVKWVWALSSLSAKQNKKKTNPKQNKKVDTPFLKIKGCQCPRHLHGRRCRNSMYMSLAGLLNPFVEIWNLHVNWLARVPTKSQASKDGKGDCWLPATTREFSSDPSGKNLPVVYLPLPFRLHPRSSLPWAIMPCFHSNQISR